VGNIINGGDIAGIIPRMNSDLFAHISAQADSTEFLVSVSYLEIYQEVLHDLLNPSDRRLQIRQHPSTGIYVDGQAEIVVRSVDEINQLMTEGNKIRQVAATNMNATSSRSHSVFTLKVMQRPLDGASKGLHAKINLVDLAGSERQASTGATGDRLKEGAAINKSLSALGNVINALADPKKKTSHIPYRDSKLTRLLQESLGGNAVTVMLAALSPASANYDETLSTLRYADRAKNIQNQSVKNEDENERVVRELREEIANLRSMLQGVGAGGGAAMDPEQMKRMEAMIADLERAKKESWKEKENVSRAYEEERLTNLQARGMMGVVLASLKEENSELKARLQEYDAEKDRLLRQFKGQKTKVGKLKASLEASIQEYSSLCSEGRAEEPATVALLEEVHVKKKLLREESDALRETKEKLRVNEEERRKAKEEMRAAHSILAEDSEIRRAIQEEERERLAKENEELLVAEKRRLAEEMERERERLRAQVGASGGGDVDGEKFMDLELKLMAERADKELLMKKVEILTQERDQLGNDLEEAHLQAQSRLEEQMTQHFAIFRSYRGHFEDEKTKMERKYMELLDEAIRDAVYLSSRNAELEQRLAELGSS
jgi:hypothetical protein